MNKTSTRVLTALILVIGGVAVWQLWLRHNEAGPLAVSPNEFSGWTLVASDGTDPWVVGMKPRDTLTSILFREASRRAGRTLIAPPHTALPLVLRSEFDEGLQGVYGTDSVLRIARDAGIEDEAFAPVCLAHRRADGPSGPADVYFVPFTSSAFNQMRVDLTPTEPEHAGIGVYEAGTLTPILIVGASEASFDRWWPLPFDPANDCEASLGSAQQGR